MAKQARIEEAIYGTQASFAFTVTAYTADGTAAFVLHNPAALRTGALDHGNAFADCVIAVCLHMRLNGFCHGVGTG